MENKKYISVLVFIMILLVLTSSISAFITPGHHTQMNNKAFENSKESPLTKEILPYKDYVQLCDMLVDISVVDYIALKDSSSWYEKLWNFITFKFTLGSKYKSTHSPSTVLRAFSKSEGNLKLKACAVGMGLHNVKDPISHVLFVPELIKKSKLWNGLVHSPGEIYIMDLFTSTQDKAEAKQILELAKDPEIVQFFQDVLVEDPAFSNVNIPSMIDFFRVQCQGDESGGYSLGFRSFFALPQYVYWLILLILLVSISMFGLTIRKIRDGIRDIPTIFIAIFSFGMLSLVSLAIYGLFTGNIWSIWQTLSQYFFSPASYLIGGLFIIFGGYILYKFIVNKNKSQILGDLPVALFILLIGAYLVTVPTNLITGNEQAVQDRAIQEAVNFLNQGANYIRTIQDPSGSVALDNANDSGSIPRTFFMLAIISLLSAILYFTFRKKK